MIINGREITYYGAKEWNVTPSFSSVSNGSQWLAGTAAPLLLNSEIGMKKFKVSVMLEGKSRSEIWKNAERLIAALLKPAEIQFRNFENFFCMVLMNASYAELSLKKFHKATLDLAGYEYGREVVVENTGTRISTENTGNLPTPVILAITPTIGKVSLTITGLVRDRYSLEDKPIKISNLTDGKTIILDGESGIITEDGVNKIGDVDIWGLPTLQPGYNIIQMNQSGMEVEMRYKPRFV